MESLNTLRGPVPPVEHPRRLTGKLLPCEERRPSALLVDASAVGLFSTTPGAASDRVSPGEGLPVEATPQHPSGKGQHHANGGQLSGRCQLTAMAVSRPLFSSRRYHSHNERHQHQQQQQLRDAPRTPICRSSSPASPRAFDFGEEAWDDFCPEPLDKKVYPGAKNLVGTVNLATPEVDVLLKHAFSKQEIDYPVIQRGFQVLSPVPLEALLSKVDGILNRLAAEGGFYIPHEATLDAITSIYVNVGRCYGALVSPTGGGGGGESGGRGGAGRGGRGGWGGSGGDGGGVGGGGGGRVWGGGGGGGNGGDSGDANGGDGGWEGWGGGSGADDGGLAGWSDGGGSLVGGGSGGGGHDGSGEDEELPHLCDENLIPAVCIYMALKLDECFGQGTLLRRLLYACGIWERDECSRVSKAVERLEWRFCNSVQFSVLPETPFTFLFHFIARAVSEGALLEDQTVSIGECAAKASLRWLRAGYLAVATPSEMAAAALELAVYSEHGAQAADTVCRAAGCPIGISDNNAMPLCRVLRENNPGILSRAPAAKPARAGKGRVAGGRCYGGGGGSDASRANERGGGGGGRGCGGGGGGGGGGGSAVWVNERFNRGDSTEYDTEDLTPPPSSSRGRQQRISEARTRGRVGMVARTPLGRGSTRHPHEVAARATAATETGPGQTIACTGIKGPAPQAPLPQHCWNIDDLERMFMSTGGGTRATVQPTPNTTAAAATAATDVTGPRGNVAGGCGGGGGGLRDVRSYASVVRQEGVALGGTAGIDEGGTRATGLEQPALGDEVVAERVRTSTEHPVAFGTGLRVEATLPARQSRDIDGAIAEAPGLSAETGVPAGVRQWRRNIAMENGSPLSGYTSGSGIGASCNRGAGGIGAGAGGRGLSGSGGGGGVGGSDGGDDNTVYGIRPADNDSTGSVTGSIVRTPVGRGIRRYPQELAACARAPTETGTGQLVSGVGFITPVPRRSLSQHWMSVVDLESVNSPPGGDMAVVVETPRVVASAAAATATAVAPGAGSCDRVGRAGDGGGGSAAYGGGGSGSGVGGGVCVGGGGGGGGICVDGGRDGDGSDRSTGWFEQARSGGPPGFEGVARAGVSRVGCQQGERWRRIREIPLATADELEGNTAGAVASRVPRYGNFHPALGYDSMHERMEAEQRTRLIRLSARLQGQRVQLQLQEAELEHQREQLERQRVLLGRQRDGQSQREVSPAPLVLWSSDGLLVPVTRTFGLPDADARRAARAAMVPPGLTRG